MHSLADWAVVGHFAGALAQFCLSYWSGIVGVIGVVGFMFRSPLVRRMRRIAKAMHSARDQSRKIEELNDKLAMEEARAKDWRARFKDMQDRYDAINAEFKRLGDDMDDFRKRMTNAEELNVMLRHDRDALIDFARLLIGQLVTAGLTPDYRMPAILSMVNDPGPPPPGQIDAP